MKKVIYDLDFDKNDEMQGVFKISLVKTPAIAEGFIALSKEGVKLSAVNDEKKLLVGPALIPDLEIIRADGSYIRFSKEVVRKNMEEFFQKGYQKNSSVEHGDEDAVGLCVVESWIVDDKENDKSNAYGIDVPEGTWMVAMKCENEEMYQMAKRGEVQGFSIEGIFPDKTQVEMSAEKLESYSDYPDGVKNNAKRVLEYVEKNGWGSCGTAVGKQRANQLASGEAITVSTIKRMYSYLSRHKGDLDSSKSYSDGCGKLMYDAWGGKAALGWSRNKLRTLGLSEELAMAELNSMTDEELSLLGDILMEVSDEDNKVDVQFVDELLRELK